MELRRKPYEMMDMREWMGLFVVSVYQNPSDLTSFRDLVPHAVTSGKNLKRLMKQKTQTDNVIAKLLMIRKHLAATEKEIV